MKLIPSVVREKSPHEAHEEQSGDYAKPQAARETRQKGCDERPNEAGQCCANSRPRYWLARRDPRQPEARTRLRAKRGECLATGACWLGQAPSGAAMPMPTTRPPPAPKPGWLVLAWRPISAQKAGFVARPGGAVWQAAGSGWPTQGEPKR